MSLFYLRTVKLVYLFVLLKNIELILNVLVPTCLNKFYERLIKSKESKLKRIYATKYTLFNILSGIIEIFKLKHFNKIYSKHLILAAKPAISHVNFQTPPSAFYITHFTAI